MIEDNKKTKKLLSNLFVQGLQPRLTSNPTIDAAKSQPWIDVFLQYFLWKIG